MERELNILIFHQQVTSQVSQWQESRTKSTSPSSQPSVFPFASHQSPNQDLSFVLSKPYLEMALDFSYYRFIAKPCALHVGIQDSGPYPAQPNAILEKVFISITKVSGKETEDESCEGLLHREGEGGEQVGIGWVVHITKRRALSCQGEYLWVTIP